MIWLVLCFIFIVFMVFMFVIDMVRFKYFERLIIFLLFCYNFYLIVFIVCVIVGMENIICDKVNYYVIVVGLNIVDYVGCLVVFLMFYYFGMVLVYGG